MGKWKKKIWEIIKSGWNMCFGSKISNWLWITRLKCHLKYIFKLFSFISLSFWRAGDKAKNLYLYRVLIEDHKNSNFFNTGRMPYLTTSRQSPSAERRKYSSPGRSWHKSSMFCSSLSPSSCLLTRSSAVTIIKKRRQKKRVFIAFRAFYLAFFYASWMIKGEFIT